MVAPHSHQGLTTSNPVAGNREIAINAEVLGASELLDAERVRRIRFFWQLSDGKLISGQGSGKIVIDPTITSSADVKHIDVKLLTEGGPPDLETEKICHLTIDPKCVAPDVFDHYDKLSFTEESQRLDRFAGYLRNSGPESVAYVIAYAGRSGCIYEGQWRADRAKKYLVKHGLREDRIVQVDGGIREEWGVDLFIQIQGSCGPLPNPTLPRALAKASRRCSDIYKN